jgi:hypothetical protein
MIPALCSLPWQGGHHSQSRLPIAFNLRHNRRRAAQQGAHAHWIPQGLRPCPVTQDTQHGCTLAQGVGQACYHQPPRMFLCGVLSAAKTRPKPCMQHTHAGCDKHCHIAVAPWRRTQNWYMHKHQQPGPCVRLAEPNSHQWSHDHTNTQPGVQHARPHNIHRLSGAEAASAVAL